MILELALNWHSRLIAEYDGTLKGLALKRRDSELSEIASNCQKFGVIGLKSIELESDPRGAALTLMFETHFEMKVAPLQFNWAVADISAPVTVKGSRPTKRTYAVEPTKLKPKVMDLLSGLSVNGLEARITQKLDKKTYGDINDVLNEMGGYWNTGRQVHVFETDAQTVIDKVIAAGHIYTARDYECFFTQEPEVRQVINLARPKPGMKVLEPNGGQGAMALAAAEIVGIENVTCYELMPKNVKVLKGLGFSIEAPQDFLQVEPQTDFDICIMNPPFSGGRDVAHIQHAFKFVKPGGVLVAIASTHWQTTETIPSFEFQRFLAQHGALITQIAAGAFKAAGTLTATTIIRLTKPAAVVTPLIQESTVRKKERVKYLGQACLF
jgi:predicted RNA methylase